MSRNEPLGNEHQELIGSLVNNAGMVRGREQVGGEICNPCDLELQADIDRHRCVRSLHVNHGKLTVAADDDIDVMMQTNGEFVGHVHS